MTGTGQMPGGPVVVPAAARHGPSALRRFLGFLRPFAATMAALGGAVVALRLLLLPVPLFYRQIVDRALPDRDPSLLLLLIGGLAAVLLVSKLLGFGLALLSARLQQGVLHEVRLALYAHLQRLDLGFYRRHATGGLLSRVMSDVAQVQGILSREVFEVGASALQLCAVGGLLLWLQPQLTLACALVFPVLIALVARFQQRLYRISRAMQERREALSARIQENLSGMRLIQTLAIEEERLGSTRAVSARLRDTVVRSEAIGAGANLLTLVLTDLPLTLFVWGYGGYLVIHGELTLGSLLAFYEYLMMLYDPVIRLFRFNLQLQVARAALDRLFEVLDTRPAVCDRAGARPLTVTAGSIRFAGVSLAYEPAGDLAVRDFALELAPGEVLGLVGPSGAGKSTVVNGLLRFLAPVAGRILVDGQDIEETTLASLRRQIGLVPQDVFLFSDTLAANIALGRPGATPEEIRAAARAAQAHDFIMALPEGYATVVGERGCGLSTGERQRIALARAFLQDPPILVLDEATSSLDAHSEELVQQALAELVRGRTTIVIAHRFTTLKLCQRIAVLAGGRLVELGSPAELHARNGLYRALLQAQQLGDPPGRGQAGEPVSARAAGEPAADPAGASGAAVQRKPAAEPGALATRLAAETEGHGSG